MENETTQAAQEVETTGTTGGTAVDTNAGEAEPAEAQNGTEDAARDANHEATQAAIGEQAQAADSESELQKAEAAVRSAFAWVKSELLSILGFDHDCEHLKAAEVNAVANIQPKQ